MRRLTMKRRELQQLGLQKEIIDQIMSLHQQDLNDYRKRLARKNQIIKQTVHTYKRYADQLYQYDKHNLNIMKQMLNELIQDYQEDCLTQQKLDQAQQELKLSRNGKQEALLQLAHQMMEKMDSAEALQGFKVESNALQLLCEKDTSLQN